MAAKKKGSERQGKAVAQKDDNSWIQTVRDKFPGLAHYIDKPEVFGTEIQNILKQAVKEKWWKNNDNGYAKMKAAIENTAYFKNTSANARSFDQMTPADQDEKVTNYRNEVVKFIGGVNLTPEAIQEISRAAARLGLTGDALSNYAYSRALTKNGSDYQYGQSAGMILAGGKADELRAVARKYFSTVTDTDIEEYLTGKKTQEDFVNGFRVKARGQYAHLAEQLDANLTLEDIAKDYHAIASNILEKPLSTINMADPKYLEAISTRDESGNQRQLTVGEWVNKIKTDRRYGYQNTKAAIDDARSLARSISRSFGATYG